MVDKFYVVIATVQFCCLFALSNYLLTNLQTENTRLYNTLLKNKNKIFIKRKLF